MRGGVCQPHMLHTAPQVCMQVLCFCFHQKALDRFVKASIRPVAHEADPWRVWEVPQGTI